METKTLHLPLKKEWYDMIERGEKKEEYRKVNPYWCKRFLSGLEDCSNEQINSIVKCLAGVYTEEYNKELFEMFFEDGNVIFKHYDIVEFTLGYPKKDDTSRRMKFSVLNIRVGKGNPAWGAETGELYFVISLGGRIS